MSSSTMSTMPWFVYSFKYFLTRATNLYVVFLLGEYTQIPSSIVTSRTSVGTLMHNVEIFSSTTALACSRTSVEHVGERDARTELVVAPID